MLGVLNYGRSNRYMSCPDGNAATFRKSIRSFGLTSPLWIAFQLHHHENIYHSRLACLKFINQTYNLPPLNSVVRYLCDVKSIRKRIHEFQLKCSRSGQVWLEQGVPQYGCKYKRIIVMMSLPQWTIMKTLPTKFFDLLTTSTYLRNR